VLLKNLFGTVERGQVEVSWARDEVSDDVELARQVVAVDANVIKTQQFSIDKE
jgi:hypothetical protein